MPVEFRKWVTRQMLRDEPDTLFVFGDNLEGWGYGGQAKEMRGEPNAVGLPTKRAPYKFLTDADLPEVVDASMTNIRRLMGAIQDGGKVIWPHDGIGTGRAELSSRAPRVMEFYEELINTLRYGSKIVE